jgi:predicted Rossmann fold flavoprotein
LKHTLIIIGGGASGLASAILAKDRGVDVAIIEGKERIGKKILTTGNGRCNISNKNVDLMEQLDRNFYHSRSCDDNSYLSILKKFSVNDTIDFFNSMGLPLTTLDNGKMYPLSLQASSVVDILRLAIEDRNIPVYTNNKASDIKIAKNTKFKIYTKCDAENNIFESDKIILCAGGKSAQNTGSDGSGYTLSKNLGHTIIPPLPGIVQLKLFYKNLKALSGIKFEGEAHLICENKIIRSELGEVLYTDYGISGPPILQLSSTVANKLYNKKDCFIRVDMFPEKTFDELKDMLENHFALFSYRSVSDCLIGIINKKLIPTLLKEADLDSIHKPVWELTWNEKKSIIDLMKNWEFKVIDMNSFNNAQVTSGGVSLKDVNLNTLESKIVPNLYFAGELLDVDGDCGGFNLQWAWSSAYVAATNALNL